VTIKPIEFILKLLVMAGLVAGISACSSDEPSPWVKSSSPWDQRKESQAEAPAADAYKADLEMADESPAANEVELSYQAEPVESFVPEDTAEPAASEPVETEAVATADEPVSESASFMEQPADYYTVQLMASVDVDRVYRFAEQNQISTEYIVPTERDGVVWHVLLLGVYPDYSSALAAKDEVAPSLTTQPWIRRVGAVQKLMR